MTKEETLELVDSLPDEEMHILSRTAFIPEKNHAHTENHQAINQEAFR